MLKHIPFYATLLDRDMGRGIKATHSHVLVYGAIEAHSFGERGCIASNETIAKETGYAIGTVKNVISEMYNAVWLKIIYTDETKQHRIVIEPLLTIETPNTKYISNPSPAGDTPVTPGLHPRHPQVTIGNSRGNINSFSSKNDISPDEGFIENDVEVEAVDDNGDPIQPKKERARKDPLLDYFTLLSIKNLGTAPVINRVAALTLLKSARQHLTDAQIKDMFEEWFGLGKPDNETIQITRALSTVRINQYKVMNGIK